MKLVQHLANLGYGSRKQVQWMFREGRVTDADGEVLYADDQVEHDAIRIDGQPLDPPPGLTLMLHKPAGYVTSTDDPRDRTVMELIPERYRKFGVTPVGRLDKETEGLLLLTNDGDLAHRILSPRSGVLKTYYAEHEGSASAEDCAAFEAGLTLGDGTKCLPARLEPQGHGKSLIHVQEGKYHQVRRMMAARGMPVTYLKRIAEGGLTLGGLEKGAVAELDVV